jgi:hypothetical protein
MSAAALAVGFYRRHHGEVGAGDYFTIIGFALLAISSAFRTTTNP